MRQVKYLIDHMGACVLEHEVLRASQAGASHGEQQASYSYMSWIIPVTTQIQVEPLSILDMDLWDQLASHCEDIYTIPRDMRNRPLPNDGRKKAKPQKKGSQKGKIAMSLAKPESSRLSNNQVASKSGEFTQHTPGSGSQSEPHALLPTGQPSSSVSASTPSPPLHTATDIRGFVPLDQLPLSLRSASFDGDISDAIERDASVQPPSSEPDLEASRAVYSSQHTDRSFVSGPVSSLSLLSKLPPFISDVPAQFSHTPPLTANSVPPEPINRSNPDRPPSPKVFCDLTHEQLRLAIKQHNATVDAKLTSQVLVNTDKNRVVFHPATNDNGTYATGSDLFRKRKKRRRPTPFFPEGSCSEEQETSSDEYEQCEEPEPHVEVDFEDLVDEAHLAKVRCRQRISRPSMLPSMVPLKPLQSKFPGATQCITNTVPLSTLTSINEEQNSHNGSGIPSHSVIFVGANGSPDEVWQLPVSAYLFLKSLAASQPQAKKLRVEQVPRLQGPPSPLLASPNRNIHSQTSKKRKFDCIEEIEYLERKSKRTHQDTTPSSCVIC